MPEIAPPVLRIIAVGLDPDSLSRLMDPAVARRLSVHPCESVESALAVARTNGCDGVLTVPRLPGSSGNALLGQFKREMPGAIRMLLLDAGVDTPGLAAVENLHQMLDRPLDATRVIEALTRVQGLAARLRSPALADWVGGAGRLPPPPQLTLELLRRSESAHVGAHELSGWVERDPVLAAKVLRLCNSALYSGGRAILDIRSAIVLLGTMTLRRLVMAGEIFSVARDPVAAASHQRLRDQSLRAAHLAGCILGGGHADTAATAALIAKVGHLLTPTTHMSPPPPEDAGAYLLALWGLPEVLVQAAAWQASPGMAGERGLDVVGATHIAWALLGEQTLDEEWVAAQGLAEQLPGWRAMAESLLAQASD